MLHVFETYLANLLKFMGFSGKNFEEKFDNEQINIVQMTNVCKTDVEELNSLLHNLL